MSDTTIIVPSAAESVTTETPAASSEVAEAAVAIAEIEAERDIRLAEIHTKSNETQTEAVLEAAEEADETDLTLEGIAECQQNIGILSEKVETLTALISERLPPAPPPPPPPSSEQSESTPAETEVPPAPPPPKTKKSRWI